ncbi:hypothetical protein OH773_01265 [Buttiauxella sp. WJP83]|uniref:hypothetical protein n=1 Tax=Buttiauxella sp. WJP83 TaxID=2986951 RepID=UPI0022DDB19E|nr:hypothetical protein [Buttiauxella sp. WJP83]WBM70927.1 hypothetical protein OH773_01265 [Buttiauxella sp. WJP83]
MNNIVKKKTRVKSLKRDALPSLWENISNQEFIEVVENSNAREISTLFSHMSASSISKVLSFLNEGAIRHVFESAQSNTITKIFSACSDKVVKDVLLMLDFITISRVVDNCTHAQRSRVLKLLPEDIRREFSREKEEKSNESRVSAYYTSTRFDDSLKNSVIERIKDLEEREAILEKNYKLKESHLISQTELAEKKLNQVNMKVKEREELIANKEKSYYDREVEIKEKIKELEKDQEELQQARLEIKFPEYVDTAVTGLKVKCAHFERKAFWWNVQGGIALFLSISAAIATFLYGGYQFNHAAKENIDWLFFLFLLVKGLIIVTLFGAWAKHAFNIANAYVHEALKRSDRMHAISFGKFYLEVYGNKVGQSEMRDIFENWNINTDSAFTKIKEPDFSLKHLEQLSTVVESIRKIKSIDTK